VGHSLGLFDLGDGSTIDMRRWSKSSLISAVCSANSSVEGASKDPEKMPSSITGAVSMSSSSSSSVESLRRPAAILAALRMAESMQSWTM
jgi:hypothetical protein